MAFFLQNLVNALQWGSFYALIALGYSMVYGVLMLFNFAHGDIFMVGAYIGFGVATGIAALASLGMIVLPGWITLVLTILISMILTSFVGILVERVGYRPLREAPRASAAITGLMIGIILETGNLALMGAQRISFPPLIESVTYNLGGIYVTNKKIMIVAVSISLMIALSQFIKKTKWGMAMRAMAYDFAVIPLDGGAPEHDCRPYLCPGLRTGRRCGHPVRHRLSGAGPLHGNRVWLEGLCGGDTRRPGLYPGCHPGRISAGIH